MENIVRTVYGSQLQTCLLLGIPLDIPDNSTLNTKFGVQVGVHIAPTDRPKMKYAAIGNGGHRMVVGSNQIAVPEPIQHGATDAALYSHIPFVLRTPNNDLSSNDRAKYAMRVQQTINGTAYIAYYLKRLDYDDVTAGMDLKSVSNGAETTTPFVPNSTNLNPTPPALDNNGVNVTTGDYVAATAKIPFSLSEAEITELLSVANIMYGSENYAVISEVALCSGVDKSVNASNSAGSFTFNEIIGAQIVTHMSNFFALKFQNGGLDVLLDVGATEPLFLTA